MEYGLVSPRQIKEVHRSTVSYPHSLSYTLFLPLSYFHSLAHTLLLTLSYDTTLSYWHSHTHAHCVFASVCVYVR